MRVLIVSLDQSRLRISLHLALRSQGFIVDAAWVEDAEPYVLDYQYDIIIAAAAECGEAEACRFVRWLRYRRHTPLLVIGTRTVGAIVQALNWGADDCLRMPYQNEELFARIRSIVRRSRGLGSSIVAAGPLTVDLARKRVSVSSVSLDLTAKEYLLVECCALRLGSPVSKPALFEHLYGSACDSEIKIIDVFVCKVRKKIRDGGAEAGHLATVWGIGYKLVAELESDPSLAASA